MDKIDVKALAKINIGLDVTGIRDDGYHEVKMIMQLLRLIQLRDYLLNKLKN